MAAEYTRRLAACSRITLVRRALAALVLATVSFTGSTFARTETPIAPLAFGPVGTFFPPAVASDGVQTLAVWNDSRDRDRNAIYGARLDANGTLLDPIGIRLFDGIGRPAIAYGDGRYFVIDPSTRFAIVDREGNVLTRGRLTDDVSGTVRVVFNGRDFVVLSGYQSVNVSVVDVEGRASEPFTLVPPHFEVRLHTAATNGSRIVVLYTRGVELRAAVASMTGARLSDSAIAPVAFAEVPASLAATPTAFVAVWTRFEGDIAAVRLDATGALVQGPVVVTDDGAAPEVIAADDAFGFFVVEGDLHAWRLVRRTLALDLVAASPVTLFESQVLSVAGYAPAETFVVTHLHDPNRRVAEEGLYALDADVAGAPRLVSRAGIVQLAPRVASGERGTLVAWREDFALGAAFLPRSGAPVSFVVDTGRIPSHSVAAEGATHLIAWESGDGIRARLYREGAAVTPPIPLDTSGFSPAAASDGSGFVVAWASVGEIRIVRITTDGRVMDETSIPYGNVTGPPAPALACDRGECVVVWRNQTARWTCPRFGCLVVDERVMALRFDSALVPIDATPLVLSEDLSGISDVTAAADRGAYAVSWVNLGQTYVRTLAGDETIVVAGAHPALAREDRGWLLVREVNGELVAMRLRDAGAPYEFALFRDAQTRTAPALARDGAIAVAAYARTTRGEAAGGVPRIYVTTIAPAESKRRAISR